MIRLTRADPLYPKRLSSVAGAPDPLWLWGTLPAEATPTIGIVGTRRLTPVGSRIAKLVTGALARAGGVIVSGLAIGIDSVAHAAALEVGGRTIAVLGEGLAYFEEHGQMRRRSLARRIRSQGALVSEYPLELGGREWTYPRRNRTIAALSDVLVVIEAPRDSGALITARDAQSFGRPVYVVPGPMDGPTWLGSNGFIAKEGGRMLASVEQVAEYLRLAVVLQETDDPVGGRLHRLAAILAAEPADADAIASALGIPTSEAAMILADSLIAGRIVATGDGRFALP